MGRGGMRRPPPIPGLIWPCRGAGRRLLSEFRASSRDSGRELRRSPRVSLGAGVPPRSLLRDAGAGGRRGASALSCGCAFRTGWLVMQVSHNRYVVPVQGLTGLQAESWRLLWEELLGDAEALAECRTWEARRGRVRPQALELLGRFLGGAVDVEELRETFDHRTKTDWDAFGLKGSSGAMFLNALAKHAPDAGVLAARLRDALPAPSEPDVAAQRLREFVDFLHAIARDGPPAGRPAYVVQPARAAFFVGMWWHLQEPERWPGFHPSARRALQLEGDLYVPAGDPIEDYFAFREAFLALAATLGVTAWALEYLCWWREHRGGEPAAEADGDAPRRYRARPSRRPLRGRPLERI